jgi:hypothetical protein
MHNLAGNGQGVAGSKEFSFFALVGNRQIVIIERWMENCLC